MAIDLQKLEQKFNALLDDPNFVTDFKKFLESRKVSQSSTNPIISDSFSADKLKEAYTDGFGDSRYDFDIENYR